MIIFFLREREKEIQKKKRGREYAKVAELLPFTKYDTFL